jgi:hypothetical protein
MDMILKRLNTAYKPASEIMKTILKKKKAKPKKSHIFKCLALQMLIHSSGESGLTHCFVLTQSPGKVEWAGRCMSPQWPEDR